MLTLQLIDRMFESYYKKFTRNCFQYISIKSKTQLCIPSLPLHTSKYTVLILRIFPRTYPVKAGWSLYLRGLEHVAMNHSVGGSNPSSPTTDPKRKIEICIIFIVATWVWSIFILLTLNHNSHQFHCWYYVKCNNVNK